jgi:hypothetical protein
MPLKTAQGRNAVPDADPFVIVDFVFDRGLLSVGIKNIGTRPAYEVKVKFSHKLMGVEGTVEVSALPLFNQLAFLPGGKEILNFLDSSASYFRSRQPVRITTQITYKDEHGRRHSNTIRHNLEIYRKIGYASLPPDSA